MAERKIIWSERAKINRYKILRYYNNRNKSNIYSRRINKRINQELRLLIKYPKLGINTDLNGVRGLIIDKFMLFYEFDRFYIKVLHLWDSRQNPEELTIK